MSPQETALIPIPEFCSRCGALEEPRCLIAAAPDLLAALLGVIGYAEEYVPVSPELGDTIENARRAIVKARGEA